MGKYNGKTCRLISIIGLVVLYFLAEVVVGYIIQSLSLIADAFHMLSDLMALVIGLISTRLTRLPRTARNTYGWQRADVVGTLINTVILSTLCFTITVRAIERFVEPHTVHKPEIMIGVGVGGLVINLISMSLLLAHGHGHTHSHTYVNSQIEDASLVNLTNTELQKSTKIPETETGCQSNDSNTSQTNCIKGDGLNLLSAPPRETESTVTTSNTVRKRNSIKTHNKNEKSGHSHTHGNKSMNMKAILLHVIADAIGSIIVVVSACIILLVPNDKKWKLYVDPTMSIIMVFIIMCSTWKLLKQSALILLQSVPKNIKVKTIEKNIENIVGSKKVHDLHIWRLQSDCIIGTVHIRCKDLADYVLSSRSVKSIFHQSDIHCTTIQPEFDEHESPHSNTKRSCALNCGPDETCNQNTCCPTNKSLPVDTLTTGDTRNIVNSV